MSDVSYLTAQGKAKIQAELQELKGPARDAIAARLRFAIQQGDLSENADYTAAKEDQAFLEGRILELESVLKNVVIIDETAIPKDVVSIGSRIIVQENDFDPETWFIVGPKEADPRNGKISHESPIGKALLGYKVGDEIEIVTPGGKIKLKIIKIG